MVRGVPAAASFCVARARAPLRCRSLGTRRSTRACRTRTPCRAGCGRFRSCERALYRRKASLLRCKTVVRRVSCGLQRQRKASLRVARPRAPLRWLSFGKRRSTRTRRVRTPCRAGCDPPRHYDRTMHRRRHPSFVARPWCDVPAAASDAHPAFAWHVCARHCASCLSGGGAARELVAHGRRATVIVIDLGTANGHCTGGTPLFFVARPWCDVSAAASNPQPAFAWHVRARHFAACLSGGGGARELAARARRAAPVAIDSGTAKGTVAAEGLFPSLQDRGATCQLWPPIYSRLLSGTCARATALAVSPEAAQHAGLLRACAVPR